MEKIIEEIGEGIIAAVLSVTFIKLFAMVLEAVSIY